MVQRTRKKSTRKASAPAARKTRARKIQTKPRARAVSRRTKAAPARGQVGTLGLFGPDEQLQGAPPHILIFLPGWLGSKLADEQGTVWFDITTIPSLGIEAWLNNLFDKMGNLNLKLRAVEVIQDIFGPLPFQQQYGRLKRLLESWGYDVRQNPSDAAPDTPGKLLCYFFPYDWRRDNRESAQDLKEAVDLLRQRHPNREIWLMGHSNGGIVSRWYLEKLGGNDIVKRLILLASPWDGAPNMMYFFIHGFSEMFGFKIDEFDIPQRTRAVLRSFPSAYQILPQARSFMFGSNGQDASPFEDTTWATDDAQKALLAAGREFNRQLGNSLHVPAIAYTGYNKPTRTEGRQLTADQTRWDNIRWKETDLVGDGTVPLYSADYNDARRFYVIGDHSDIYMNEELQKRLKRQLLTGGTGDEGVLGIEAPATDAVLDIEPRSPEPGKRVNLTVVLTARDAEPQPDKSPTTLETVTADRVSGTLRWLQGLPLSTAVPPAQSSRRIQFRADPEMAGRYRARFQAPAQEGYYELETTIEVADQEPLTLRNTLLVQAAA